MAQHVKSRLQEKKEQDYGDSYQNTASLANAWTQILRVYLREDIPDLPPRIAGIMLAQMKLLRLAISEPEGLNDDNYEDAKVYIDISQQCKDHIAGESK